MAKIEQAGGMLYIGDAPAAENIPNHDSHIDETQVITSAVVAGPITIAASVTIEVNFVVV